MAAPVSDWSMFGGAHAHLFLNMFVALVLGLAFGYERSYHGRAAGMRTYGLVCMVAAALTAVSGLPMDWYGAQVAGIGNIDPTRTVQGIVTGIGFLGAGIIMKDGLHISGLTTAASIWAAAAIGILVGFDFYLAAIELTVLSAGFVMIGPRVANILPSRRPVAISLLFRRGYVPDEEAVTRMVLGQGYEIAKGSLSIRCHENKMEWRFVAIAAGLRKELSLSELAGRLFKLEGVDDFHLSRARN